MKFMKVKNINKISNKIDKPIKNDDDNDAILSLRVFSSLCKRIIINYISYRKYGIT